MNIINQVIFKNMKKLRALLLELMGLKRSNVFYMDENDETIWIDRQFMFDVPVKKTHIQKDKKYYIVDLIVIDYDNYSHTVVEVHLKQM